MAQGILYMVDESGALHRMAPSAPASEDHMQSLVARYPELITDGDGDLLLIRREQPIGDSDESSSRWSLDHLFVTRDAVPVLVELKRAVDTRLRREVVGQILDYAANSTAYWQAGRIADAFATTALGSGADPEQVLADFLGNSDIEAFWAQVDSNFKAGRIKLVFVADTIPRELARIVEFLNDQMRADVRAVELRWFAGEGGVTTLSPRIIGETERAKSSKAAARLPVIDRDAWLDKHLLPLGANAVQAAHVFIDTIEQTGGETGVGSANGSLLSIFRSPSGRKYFPFHLWGTKNGQLSFSLQYLSNFAPFSSEETRRYLYDEAVSVFGPLSSKNLSGLPSADITSLNQSDVASGFRNLIEKVKAIAKEA